MPWARCLGLGRQRLAPTVRADRLYLNLLIHGPCMIAHDTHPGTTDQNVRVYVYQMLITCRYTYLYACSHRHMHGHVCAHVDTNVAMNVHTDVDAPFYAHARTRARAHARAHAHARTHARTHARVHARTRARAHARMHARRCWWMLRITNGRSDCRADSEGCAPDLGAKCCAG